MKWLLSERGYSSASGIDSLNGAIKDTLACRSEWQFPHRYVVLNNWDDAGVVWMDAGSEDENGEYRIFWGSPEDFLTLLLGEERRQKSDIDEFVGYPEWTAFEMEQNRE
jgi:hypothetical protein